MDAAVGRSAWERATRAPLSTSTVTAKFACRWSAQLHHKRPDIVGRRPAAHQSKPSRRGPPRGVGNGAVLEVGVAEVALGGRADYMNLRPDTSHGSIRVRVRHAGGLVPWAS
jgi:hypothetical protein